MTSGEPCLVALDVDGTVVDQDERLTDPVRDAVRALCETGAHVVLATGRSLVGTLPVLDRLGLVGPGWVVCSNGAVTVRLDPALETGWQIADVVTFDPGPALRLLRAELPAALYAVEELGVGFRVTAPFPDGELSGQVRVVDFAELAEGPASRVVVRSPDQTPEEFLAVVRRVGLHGVSYAVGWTAWLDLAPGGVNKASALEQVRRRLGVDPARTIAVGDGRNDVEMLAWAARGVAMGNAPDEVRRVAAEVCGTVADDGLVDVLAALL